MRLVLAPYASLVPRLSSHAHVIIDDLCTHKKTRESLVRDDISFAVQNVHCKLCGRTKQAAMYM